MNKPGERQRRWREQNAERVREYKKEYLRRKWLPAFLAETGDTIPVGMPDDHASATVRDGTA